MKTKFLIILFLAISFGIKAQNYTPLNYFLNGTPTHGIKIKTNLPFQNGSQMPTLIIEGYNYGKGQTIGIILNWYIYNNKFISYSASNHGVYAPTIKLAKDENGKVIIYLDSRGYYNRFQVRAYANGRSQSIASNYEGWTAVDEPLIETKIVTVPYKSADNEQSIWSETGNSINYNLGNVAIGTTNTSNGLLTLNGENMNLLRLENDGLGSEAMMRFRSKSISGGTLHSDISLYATGNNQGYLGFKVPHNNTANSGYNMIINHLGRVGIGTIDPGDWKLAVKGNIRAEEIKVETGWSDFVFYKDYNLPTLEEVENHIKEKGHLKDIPSAEEVTKNGIFLGEMNAKLLQKIEELTLYTIEQEKKLTSQEKQIEELKQKFNHLEKLIRTKQ